MSPKVTTIFEQDTDSGKTGVLGIDDDARLYWNDKLIVTEKKVVLSWWVNLSIIVGGLSTLVIAVFTALMYFR